MSNENIFQRLPKNIKPSQYEIHLRPNLTSLTFSGTTSIKITILEPTDQIILNAINLNFDSVRLEGKENRNPTKTIFCSDDERAIIKFNEKIEEGEYNLNITFNGTISDSLRGFYRSKYVGEDGTQKYAAVTQFCATDARSCFPCWDEPAIKATFNISLTVPKNLTALSNMPVIQSRDESNELIRYDFDKTPVMSTYLVAFVIGEYDYVEKTSSDGVLVRVYTPKGRKEQGLYALDVAVQVLPFYKDYFNTAYPLPKIDLVTVADFSFGAMENWGLVTYRETRLLVDPENTSEMNRQAVAMVVGHELAHQWFGNLVTMEWWTHLWLNEGFASFIPNLCLDKLFPDFHVWVQFIDTYNKALELDGLRNSHPIEIPINNPYELFEIFDAISYNKGASVIRMLHSYIGDCDFRKGMNLYLTKHMYQNTCTEDLWNALEEGSGKPVSKIMPSWTKQIGYPMISVSVAPAESGVLLTFTQDKFTSDGSDPPEECSWIIPIDVTTAKNSVVSTLLEAKECSLFIPDVTIDEWIKVNPLSNGFYRVKYPEDMLAKLIPAVREQTLSTIDRLSILNDLFAMVKAGHANTVQILKILKAYEGEMDFNIWASILNILGSLGKLLASTNYGPDFNKYQKELLKTISGRIDWEEKPNETHLKKLLRATILARLASLGDENVIQEARKRFEAHVKCEKTLPANLRSVCYKAVIRCGGNKEYDTLLGLYRSTDLHEEKERIIGALGSTVSPRLLSNTLAFAMTDEVRAQDMPSVILSVATSLVGRKLAWNHFKQHSKKISERTSTVLLTRLVKTLVQDFASEEMALEVEEYFSTNPLPGTERSIQQAVETIRLNSKWLKRDSDSIRIFLKEC